jgi:hypothetical protein
MKHMNWSGVVVGAIAFLIIGIFHPIVIKCEYYFSSKIWPVFLVGGLACCAASLLVAQTVVSSALAVLGFAMLWSIGELRQQERRVKKGWFPCNPNRRKACESRAKSACDDTGDGLL